MEQSPPIPSSRTRSSSRAGESEKHAQFHALHAKASRTKAAGDLGRAIALYREALDVYESCSHPNPSYLAGALQNLAYTLTEHSLGEHSHEAETLYRRAASVSERAGLRASANHVAILDNLTNFYRQRRLWQQAAAVCAEAVACAREAHGDTSQKVGPFLEKHAQLLILSGDATGAAEAARGSIELLGGERTAQRTRLLMMQCCLGTALGEIAWHTRDDELMDEAEKVLGTAAAEGEQIWSAAARQSSKEQQEREEREKEKRQRQRKASSADVIQRRASLAAARDSPEAEAEAKTEAEAKGEAGARDDDDGRGAEDVEEGEIECNNKEDEEPIVADFRLITCLERLSMFAGFYRKDKAQAERLAMKVANIVSEMRDAGKGRRTQLVSKENLEEALAFLGAVHEGKFLSPMAYARWKAF